MKNVRDARITVLVPTFNRAEFLPECLDSLLNQTLPATQILVVNDASTDNTEKALEPYGTAIDYLETPQISKPSAINAGMGKVTGEYLWIFDDDDVALPHALESLVAPLVGHPEYGFSYCSFYYTSSDPETGKIGKVIRELTIPDFTKRGKLIPLLEWNYLGGAAVFARMTCYEKVGLFDPQLMRSQDYEMAIRLVRHFKSVRAEGGPLFHYRQHGGTRGAEKDRFPADHQPLKWYEYGQIHFRNNYRTIPLDEYLPPGMGPDQNRRHAFLQRMTVMAFRHLMPEMKQDLCELAKLNDIKPFTDDEYTIIWSLLFGAPYPGVSPITNVPGFFGELRSLAKTSAGIRLLRRRVARNLLIHCTKHLNPVVWFRNLALFVRCYI